MASIKTETSDPLWWEWLLFFGAAGLGIGFASGWCAIIEWAGENHILSNLF